MHIYTITHIVSGKKYVGRTERRDPNRRWAEHRSAAVRLSGPQTNHPLYRAMRKHGISNFEFQVIETVQHRDQLPTREAYWITYYDSVAPKGYNLETYQDNRRIYCEEIGKKTSHSLQGIKRGHSSSFKGVTKVKTGYYTEIRKGQVRLARWFKNEEEAARMYDCLALYLYGVEAEINFQESRQLSQQELKKVYDRFNTAPKASSQYLGVWWDETKKRWIADIGDKRRKSCKEEVEAAEMYDKACLWRFGDTFSGSLNFPEKRINYLSTDLNSLFSKKEVKSPAVGIRFRPVKNGYRARLTLGVWTLLTSGLPTLEAAQAELNAMKAKLNIL